MKRYQPLFLSLLCGTLLAASWPVSPFTFFIFFAFVPYLWLEEMSKDRLKLFCWTFLTMLIWNSATTWWICNSTVPGGIAAIIANSLLMCIPLMGFNKVKRRLGPVAGYLALAGFWLTFEYVHLNWQLSWPWLTLGNVFSIHPAWVQWYEYTGTSGGSLWILATNVLLFVAIKRLSSRAYSWRSRFVLITALVIIAPFFISFLIQPPAPVVPPGTKNFVVVQPNIDPYKKFGSGNQDAQLRQLLKLSESMIDSNTAILVWPETALSNDTQTINLDYLKRNRFLDPVWEFLKSHPSLKLFTGIEGIRIFNNSTKNEFSRATANPNFFYDSYNAAALLDSSGALQIYNKSKLVPGVETTPSFLKFLDKWFEQFGGTTGGYATQKERTVLSDPQSGYRIAPAICYESIYGEFLGNYIRNGANVITIITNDGWWANTSGHKQHVQYARLRAIESRRWIVRSANTGISCFISPLGEILDPQPWDTEAAIKRAIPQSTDLTFYAKYGDILSKAAIGVAIILFLSSIFTWARRKFYQQEKHEQNALS